MISPESPGHIEDEKKYPPSEKQGGDKKECGCGHNHSDAEDSVNSANEFMKKSLKKAEG